MVSGPLRILLRRLHLWLALLCGLPLLLIGLSGTALVWHGELDRWLNPQLLRASVPLTPAQMQAPALALQTQRLAQQLAGDSRYGPPERLMLPLQPEQVYVAWYPATAGAEGIAATWRRQVMLDPVSGAVLGERLWGEPGLSRAQLMPTVFHLHMYFLAGKPGRTLVGLMGLGLMLLMLSALALWWPARSQGWRRSCRVAYGGSLRRLWTTLHRQGGGVLVPLLAFLGFSGLYFNLPDWVRPAVAAVLPMAQPAPPVLHRPWPRPGVAEVVAEPSADSAAHWMLASASLYPAARLTAIAWSPVRDCPTVTVRLRQPGEWRQRVGGTRLHWHSCTGALQKIQDPGRDPAGDRILSALFPLHTAEVLRLPGRIVLTLLGLTPLIWLLTGLYLWWRRKPQRRVEG